MATSSGDVTQQVAHGARGGSAAAHPDRAQSAAKVQARDLDGTQTPEFEIVGDGQPAQNSRPRLREHRRAYRGSAGQFERGRNLVGSGDTP